MEAQTSHSTSLTTVFFAPCSLSTTCSEVLLAHGIEVVGSTCHIQPQLSQLLVAGHLQADEACQ